MLKFSNNNMQINSHSVPPMMLFLLLWLLWSSCILPCSWGNEENVIKCNKTEREALLNFKQGLTDPSGSLSSWDGDDCCKWRGVGCSNTTGHVFKLNLTNPVANPSLDSAETTSQILSTLEKDAYLKSQLGDEWDRSSEHLATLGASFFESRWEFMARCSNRSSFLKSHKGRIPSGYQLQTLDDPSIYEGNPLLCGDPLPMKCPDDDTSDGNTSTNGSAEDNSDEKNSEMIWFYVSMGPGFVVGFWGVCGTLLVKKTWRHAFFQFIDDVRDWISLMIALKVAAMRRKVGLEQN